MVSEEIREAVQKLRQINGVSFEIRLPVDKEQFLKSLNLEQYGLLVVGVSLELKRYDYYVHLIVDCNATLLQFNEFLSALNDALKKTGKGHIIGVFPREYNESPEIILGYYEEV